MPAIIAAALGAASILAYVFCGILITLLMLCVAEVASKITETGGALELLGKLTSMENAKYIKGIMGFKNN